MLWACVLLPQLALDAVLRRLPDPDAPLALVGGAVQLRTLQAVNASAAQAGLRAGMRLTAAHALLPEFAMVEYDPSAEARWQRFLAAWAYRHSSLVSAQWPGLPGAGGARQLPPAGTLAAHRGAPTRGARARWGSSIGSRWRPRRARRMCSPGCAMAWR